jgi:hypothetical protein
MFSRTTIESSTTSPIASTARAASA